jgi:hypothetical protein
MLGRDQCHALADVLRVPELSDPGGHAAFGIDRAAQVHQGRRPLGIPPVFVLPRPLDPDGAPNGTGEEGGVGGGVLVAVAAVTSRAVEVIDPDRGGL